MKSKLLLFALSVSGLVVQSVFAQNQAILPHVANGVFPGGAFRTTFMVVNNTDSAATAVLSLTKDNGEPLEIALLGLGTQSTFTLTLAPGATRTLRTDGSGSLVTGAATVTATAKISVSGTFTVLDPAGNFVTESGIGDSSLMRDLVIPVDNTATYSTGLAVFSPQGGTAGFTLIDTNGQTAATTTLSLANKGHIARFITDLFPSAANFRGTLVVQSSAVVAAMVLRQNQTPQTLSYTSLPVVALSSTQQSFNLAHIVNGTFAGGQFRTSILLFNLSASQAAVTVAITKDDGSPYVVTIPGLGTNSTSTLQIPAGGAVFLQTDGSGPLLGGAAVINSNVPVGVSAVFAALDTQGKFLTEAGVGDSPPMTEFTVPVDVTGSFDTGIAFYNPSTAAVSLNLRLLDADGGTAGAAQLTLPPKSHIARFASELFSAARNLRGSIAASGTGSVTALALRQNTIAGTPTYTTMPVISGVSRGTISPPISTLLLPKTETGVGVTSDVTLNETLPTGFRLKGVVSDSASQSAGWSYLLAQSGGNAFSGEVDLASGRYTVVVPAGSYTLNVCSLRRLDAGSVMGMANAGSVQVSDHTTKNISKDAVNLFSVSGTVAGLDNLPTYPSTPDLPGYRSIHFVSADNTVVGRFSLDATGTWQGMLPSGTFSASVYVSSDLYDSETMSLATGSLTVSGGPVTGSFTVPPTAQISGIVRNSPGRSPRVSARDASMTGFSSAKCVAPALSSDDFGSDVSAAVANDLGYYQMPLVKNRIYSVSVQTDAPSAGRMAPVVFFPTSRNAVDITDDTTFDLMIPGLPGTVTLSGKVTDPSGQPVFPCAILAVSDSITGAPGISSQGTGRTDPNGNYSINLLSGTNYRVTFFPHPEFIW